MFRDGHRVACLATELGDAARGHLDVVDIEVHAQSMLARLHGRYSCALAVADTGHVVLVRARERLELPPEQPTPERLRAGRVVSRDLNMHNLTGHVPAPHVVASPGLLTQTVESTHPRRPFVLRAAE